MTLEETIHHYEQQIKVLSDTLFYLKKLELKHNSKKDKTSRRIITKEQAEWAYEQWLIYGRTYKEIAKLFYVDRCTITRAIDGYGINRRYIRPDLELPEKFK